MSRSAHPLAVADVSAFARSLRSQLGRLGHGPSHVEMLNLVCRAAGWRNYQAFRAHAATPVSAPPPAPRYDRAQVEKATRQFDDHGRLLQWPARAKQAELCLWVLWSRVPAAAVFTEREISRLLNQWHVFGDAALLRRALFDFGFVDRNRDGSEYRRIERKPPDELKPLLFVLRMRQDTAVA